MNICERKTSPSCNDLSFSLSIKYAAKAITKQFFASDLVNHNRQLEMVTRICGGEMVHVQCICICSSRCSN